MSTVYLRFPSEATGMAALQAAKLLDAASKPVLASHDHALDIVGVITIPGADQAPPTVLPGWHVNYIGKLPAGWEQYQVAPAVPYRVFAS